MEPQHGGALRVGGPGADPRSGNFADGDVFDAGAAGQGQELLQSVDGCPALLN